MYFCLISGFGRGGKQVMERPDKALPLKWPLRSAVTVVFGRVAWKTPHFEGIDYMKTHHPASGVRFPGIKKRFEKDIK